MTNRNRFINLIVVTLMFFFSTKLTYAGASGMSEEQMEALMKNAEKMQECMAKVDQSEMQKLSQKSQKMHEEVQALCKADKKDEAQKRAIEFGQETANSRALQEMKKCGEMMQLPPGIAGAEDLASGKQHVCDNF